VASTIALIGHPVAHSISPPMQQAALDALGVDATYEAWDIPSPDLPIAIERLRSGSVLGANVTVPHKVEALRLIDRPDAIAERVGATNTITNDRGRLVATNTDVAGILSALAAADVEVRDAAVLLLGAGGAARAVIVALRRAGASNVTIANRTLARATALTLLGGSELPVQAIELSPSGGEPSEALRAAAERASIVVNATSVGMRSGPAPLASPLAASLLHRGQAVFDLVYTPRETALLAAAEAAGARPVAGLAMLVHQGAEALRLWTGNEPPLDVMFEAAQRALDETG
jgi:shikimate dehydrogenase